MYRYKKPVYSEEQYRRWDAAEEYKQKMYKEHSRETIKDYEVAGYTIRCIQRKYDKCMNKENEYGVQVWADKPENVPVEKINDYCVANEWFNNPEQGNEYFKQVKAMCY